MKGSIYFEKKTKKYYPYVYLSKEQNDGFKGKKVWGEGSTNKRTADANLRALLSKYDNNSILTSKSEKFSDIYEQWKELIAPELYGSEQTKITNFGYIANHILPVFGEKRIDLITKQEIQKTFFKLRKKGSGEPLSDATRKKILSILNSIFNSAKDWGQVMENPCDIKLKEPKILKKEVWSVEQLNLFLNYVKKEKTFYYLPFLILATTGIRRGEVCGLQWSDYKKDYLVLDRAVDLKGNITDMKTDSSHRRVVLMGICREEIEMQHLTQERLIGALKSQSGIQDKIKPWDFICTNDYNYPLLPNALTNSFRRYIRRINKEYENILPEIPLKNLRHTFATNALGKGINVKVVSEILGHARTSTTQNSYSQYQDTMQVKAMRQMENTIFNDSVRNSVRKIKKA